ncbi:alpha-ketoglutarate-dependent dioxygenase alkB homolog 7, mitochondrial [Bufo gargarizans]|uniref:alpha-ketoglutarate-dependent dioxygenase alkB homolog 7, mitochondrial n=1 Tax=Bufo gargarizans TaxID=30331 RepID=UPI001CF4CE7B|nr:alpha-ketoglutarate-dependent dioxygenase alkB homolog 7, mitochondrial [Bufo gargarizans]
MAAPSARCCLGNMRPWLNCVTRPRGLFVVISGVLARCHHAVPLPDNQISPSSTAVLSQLSPDLTLQPDFITAEEEAALCRELEPVLRKKRYESGHWDDAIHGFREVERLHWSPDSSAILQRVRDMAFPTGETQLSQVHVLDLQKDGYIKPHVDSIKFCGSTIAGICLLSSSVMRLVSVDNPEERADLLLPRRCLYIMSGVARYKFTHEILRGEESFFNGVPVPRERRISVICRNLPVS